MKGGLLDGASGEEATSAGKPISTDGQGSNHSSPTGSPNYITVSGSSFAAGPTPALASSSSTEDAHQQLVPERFAWRGDSYTTPAIRG